MIHILIADPDSTTRRALTLLLQRRLDPSSLSEVQDVETLIRSLADTSPELLLLDWRLHGSPVPEICRLLQKAYPYLKIVLLSVDANDAPAAKGVGAAFVHKGASPDELIATLTPLLRRD
jgi:DNA-binding NarL/FixJ family response regulator